MTRRDGGIDEVGAHCPKCEAEYRPGFTTCADCGVPLVPGPAASPRDSEPPEVERDEEGFVRTGPRLYRSRHWSARRHPFLLETSRAGVFAAGDVRAGSVKRVASAVGEGAMAVQFVHEYLREM